MTVSLIILAVVFVTAVITGSVTIALGIRAHKAVRAASRRHAIRTNTRHTIRNR